MRLLNPIMLSCLAVMVLPLVLHLLNRSRYRQVKWGAMMFLGEESSPHTDPSRWKRWGLLSLRVLLLGVIVFALSRPIITSTPSAESTRLAVVFVIDATPSMGHPEIVDTRLAIARRTASSILSQLQRGDQAGLVILGQPQNRDIPLTSDLQDIATRIASLGLSIETGNMNDGQRRAAVLLQQAEQLPGKIYLIGDRDLENWATLEKLDRSNEPALTIAAIPIGTTVNDNISVVQASIENQPVIAGKSFQLQIEIKNHSNNDRFQLPVTIRDFSETVDATTVDLPARKSIVINRTLTLDRAGDHLLTASISHSGLPGDDFREVIASVIPPIQSIKLTSDSPEWDRLHEIGKKVVVVDDFSTIGDLRLGDLEDFVFTGGGVLISQNPAAEQELWNGLFNRDSDGLAPSAISHFEFNVTKILAGKSIQLPRVASFSNVTVDNTLIRFADGSPLMQYREYGKGRVITSAISIDEPEFVKFVEYQSIISRVMHYLGTGDYKSRNLPLKSLLEQTFDSTRERVFWITRPDGRGERVPMQMNGSAATAVYSNTEIPGRYTIRIPNTPGTDYIIYGQSIESNLLLLNDSQLAPIFRSAQIDQVSEEAIRIEPHLPYRQRELTLNLLLAALAMLGIEYFVSRRLSGGCT